MVDMDLAFSQLPRPIFHRLKDDQAAQMKADAAPVLLSKATATAIPNAHPPHARQGSLALRCSRHSDKHREVLRFTSPA
jgi:hypothetical protein